MCRDRADEIIERIAAAALPGEPSIGRDREDMLQKFAANLSQGIEAAYNEVDPSDERDYLLEFLSNIRRGYAGRQNDPNRPRPR